MLCLLGNQPYWQPALCSGPPVKLHGDRDASLTKAIGETASCWSVASRFVCSTLTWLSSITQPTMGQVLCGIAILAAVVVIVLGLVVFLTVGIWLIVR